MTAQQTILAIGGVGSFVLITYGLVSLYRFGGRGVVLLVSFVMFVVSFYIYANEDWLLVVNAVLRLSGLIGIVLGIVQLARKPAEK